MPEVADLWITLRGVTAPLTDSLAAAGVEADRFAAQLKLMQTEATRAGTRLTALGAEGERAAVGLRSTAAAARTSGTAMEASAARTEAFGGKLLGLGPIFNKVAKWGSIGLAGISILSIKLASDFDAAMAKLNTQANVPKAAIAGLSDGVLKLAGQVGFSPDSLAEALYHVESNFESMGISSAKALELTKVAAEGAAVGHANLIDVTNALTAAVAAEIPGVENLDQAMGILNQTVGIGDMNMQDLAAAFGSGMVATVKGFGLNIRDVAAGLAVFGDNNIRGANAGTQLRMSVMALANPIKGSEAALKTLGLEHDTLAKDMQKGGLKLALEDLADRMKKAGITAEQQGQIITEAFGRKAGAGLNVLMDQIPRLESKYAALGEGANKFGDAWKTTSETLRQQLRGIEYGAEAAAIKFGEVLIPYVSKGITLIEKVGGRAVTDLVDLWDIYGPAVGAKLSAGASFVESGARKLLAPVKAEVLSVATTVLPLLPKAFDHLSSSFDKAKDAAQPVVDGLKDLYKSAVSSGGALDTLTGRIKAGATVVGAFGVGVGHTTSLLGPLGQAVGGLVHAFSTLPGWVQLSAFSMLALRPFRPQIDAMQQSVLGFGRAGITAFRGIGDAALYQRVLAAGAGQELGRFGGYIAALESRVPVFARMGNSFRDAAGQIRNADGSLGGFRSNVAGLSAALGTGARAGLTGALRGMYTMLGGPFGIALTGAMIGLDMLAKHQQQAAAAAEAHRARISSLVSALKDSNGVINASVRATAVQTLADMKLKDGKTALLDALHKVGISTTEATDAYLGQGSSIDALRSRILAYADANKVQVKSSDMVGKSVMVQDAAYTQVADTLATLFGEVPDALKKQKDLNDALNGGGKAAEEAASPTGRLKTLIGTLTSVESSADEKARALHQALQLLAGKSLDVQAAVANQNASILDLSSAFQDGADKAKGYGAALLNADGSINTATQNGQDLFNKLSAISEQTSAAAQATYDYARANHESVPDALQAAEGAMQSSWDAIVATGQKLGLTKDQAENLAVQMGMIPSNLAITLAVKDLSPTQQAMLYVQGLADHLKEGAVVKVSALPQEALKALNDVGIKTKTLPDGHIQITVPSKDVIAKLAEIDAIRLHPKSLTIDVRTVGDGYQHGSVQATYADGGMVPKFADGGVLHAANGLTVPGYAPRRDTVHALLTPGEGVLVPEAVRAIGGARTISALNHGARSGTLTATRPSRPATGGGGDTHITNHFHIAGSVLTEQDLLALIERKFLTKGAHNSGTYVAYGRR